MARLVDIGLEFQSLTAGHEFTAVGTGITLETSIVKSGTQSLKVTTSTGTRQGGVHAWRTTTSVGPFFVRFGLYIGTAPTSDNLIAVFSNNNAISSTVITTIILTSSRTLKLQYVNGGASFVDVGSPSAALNTGQWYQIFMKFDGTAGIAEAKIDNAAAFASASGLTFFANVMSFRCGTNLSAGSDTTGVVYFDDIAINDNTGSAETDYPTYNEKLVLSRPTGASDLAAEVGIFSSINEAAMNDTSTGSSDRIELQTNTTNADYAMSSSGTLGIGASDTITHVAPYARVAGATATAANYILRIKTADGAIAGTSGAVALASASFLTNPTSTTPFGTQYVAYLDTTTSGAWTAASITAMRVGVGTTDGNPDTYVTWLAAYVGYVPGTSANSTLNNYQFVKVGDGMSTGEKIK